MNWRIALILAALAGLWGCNKPTTDTLPDAGEDDAGYDGPTGSGVIPQFDPDSIDASTPLIDAGEVTADTRCCTTFFSISDQEPADAVGVLEGSHYAFSGGIPLARTDAGWTASLCFPLNASATFWYRFSSDGGVFDGGEVVFDDGGVGLELTPLVATSIRASDREPTFVDSNGDTLNVYGQVSSCDGLDGGVPAP